MNTTVVLFEPDSGHAYTLDEVARITGVPRHSVAVYCRWGLIEPLGDPDSRGWQFDDEAIRALRRIEYLRNHYDMNIDATRIIFGLLQEIEELREEVRFLRAR